MIRRYYRQSNEEYSRNLINRRDLAELSILCVDDVEENLLVLRRMLKIIGVNDVRIATTGTEALGIVEDRAPDIIITDLWMPGMNGFVFAQAVAAVPRIPEIRLIALTADTMAVENRACLKIFEQILVKPATIMKLSEVISSRPAFNPHRLQDLNRQSEICSA